MSGAVCNLVLIGFMGCGKSTIGRICASRLGLPFVDTDARIVAAAGMPISRLFEEKGESEFRRMESETIGHLASRRGVVIATGGGVVLDPRNVASLRESGFVVLLQTDPATILERVSRRNTRPLIAEAPDPHARILELLEQREPLYTGAAHARIDTGARTPPDIAGEIVKLFRQVRSRGKRGA